MSGYLKDPASGLVHVLGFLLAVIGSGFLLGRAHGAASIAVTVIYALCLILLYGASAIYHLMPADERLTRALRLLDHVAIFLAVAGTSTPLLYHAMRGRPRVLMLAMIWGLAVIGTIVKLSWSSAPRSVYTAMYVVMGWSLLAAFGPLRTLPSTALVLVVAGGVVYTLGAVIYARTMHRVWHTFVLLGSVLHFVAIAQL